MNNKNFSTAKSKSRQEPEKETPKNRTKCLVGMIGVALCGALPGYTAYGQSSLSVGVSVPLPGIRDSCRERFL